MKIYLDVSCLNRPFDDQSQVRIRLEAEAVALVMERMDLGVWEQISSQMVTLEVEAIGDPDRKECVQTLLKDVEICVRLADKEFSRAAILEKLGFKAADALHVAAAESAAADVLLSCDDRLCRLAKRCRCELLVHVVNPLVWLQELEHDSNA
jgi:predicted nucleic acid-binding protein